MQGFGLKTQLIMVKYGSGESCADIRLLRRIEMNKESKDAKSPVLGSVFRVFFILVLGVGVLFLCISINGHLDWGPKETTPVLTDTGIKPAGEVELLTASEEKLNTTDDSQLTTSDDPKRNAELIKSKTEKALKVPSEKDETTSKQPDQNEAQPQKPAEIIIVSDDRPKEPPKDEDTEGAAPSDAIKEAQEIVRNIADTVEIDSARGNVSYKQDDIPNYLHLTFKAEAFNLSGACVGRFVSDAGWMVHPENYDSSAKELTKNLGVSDFKDKMVIVNITMRQLENGEPAGEHVSLQIIYDYDGSVSERVVTK